MREQILYYALKYQGDWKKIKLALQHGEVWHKVECMYAYITYMDENYPACFHELECPPWILFYEGDINLLKKTCVSVIGSRECTAYGIEICRHIVAIVKQKKVIVSGLAKGIDKIAHEEALSHKTIGVIGCGIDIIYPKENAELYRIMRERQLIISEYPPGVKPLAYHFPWRNRLIAALSDAVVVVQAKLRSGTLLTVNEALYLNKDVYCVPYTIYDESGKGCNLLISQGANLILDDKDIEDI